MLRKGNFLFYFSYFPFTVVDTNLPVQQFNAFLGICLKVLESDHMLSTGNHWKANALT